MVYYYFVPTASSNEVSNFQMWQCPNIKSASAKKEVSYDNIEGMSTKLILLKVDVIFQEAEEKRKKEEELEKQKQLEEESAKEDTDSKVSMVLDRLDTLEAVVKEIVDDKRKISSPDLPTKEEVAKKDKASPGKASDSKNDSQPVTVKSKDISSAANAAKPNIKAFPVESES